MKKTQTVLFKIYFIVTILFTACVNDDYPQEEEVNKPVLYLAGLAVDESTGLTRIAYWKNGEKTFLPNSNGYEPTSIKVNSGNIYIAGIELTSKKVKIWKNISEEFVLDENEQYDKVYIDLSGEDLHAMCTRNNNSVHYKNFNKIASYDDFISDFAVLENNVYACASNYARFWKNGIEIELKQPEPDLASASSLSISNDKIYVTGVISDNRPVYWKDGVITIFQLEALAHANKLIVSGNDVYVAGFSYDLNKEEVYPTYWKNGEKIVLDKTIKNTYLFDLAVSNSGKVYALGRRNGETILWVDGKIDNEINLKNSYSIIGMFLEEKK